MMKIYQQTGVALISALLVVALAATAAASLSSSMQINLRRSANLYTRDQAWEYLLGVEEFAKVLINQSIKNEKLHLLLGQEQALPIDGGVVTGRITDLQAGLNINDLLKKNGQVDSYVSSLITEIFKTQEIDPKIISILIDWMDADSEVGGADGAEDDYYYGLQPPYRTANGQLDSLSELQLLKGIKPEQVKGLLGFKEEDKPVRLISAIRKSGDALNQPTLINLNTAPAMLLSLLGMDPEKVVEGRPYKNKPTNPSQLGLGSGDQLDRLGVESNYYHLEASAQIGRAKLRSYSVFHRSEQGTIRVISRALGTE